jgi:hypothetical protein
MRLINCLKLTILLGILWLAVSCGSGNGGGTGNSTSLTGIWRLEFNNVLYQLNDNGTTVEVKVCNMQDPVTLNQTDGYLGTASGNFFFKINSPTQLEISEGPFTGTKLIKNSDKSTFNSGQLSIQSSNITDLSASSNVCAYRESDYAYNIIAAPYEGGYLEMWVEVKSKAAGNYLIPTDTSILIESAQLPGTTISANSGSIDVIEYTDVKFKADYQFTAIDGNEYKGSIDVDL